MKRSALLLSSFLVGLFVPTLVLAAACCGGGFAAPSIISGDDRAQLTTSYAFTEVVVDNVDSRGVWREWDDHQQVQILKIEAAHIFADRWQAGFTLPVIQRSHLKDDYSGLGDLAGTVGYEYLPDWNYSAWRPKGIGFLQLTVPTGYSRAESEVGGLDSRGNGFWAVGAGTLLTKTFRRLDVFSSFEVHRSFGKSVSNAQIQGELRPGYGGNFGLGAGYNTTDFRYGTSLTWTYEDPVALEGQSSSSGSVERYATGVASVSYMASDEWAGTLSYSDQTLFGDPVNTSLGKSVAVVLQRRWAR